MIILLYYWGKWIIIMGDTTYQIHISWIVFNLSIVQFKENSNWHSVKLLSHLHLRKQNASDLPAREHYCVIQVILLRTHPLQAAESA